MDARSHRCSARSTPSAALMIRRKAAILTVILMATITMTTNLPLYIWLSPNFPVGAFAYSHGLEWAAQTGDVTDAGTACDWISDVISCGSGRNDAVILAAAYRAVAAHDDAALSEISDLAIALQPSKERLLETISQGNAFIEAVRVSWPSPALEKIRDDCAYPVAIAIAAASHDIALEPTLEVFLLSSVSNLVSATVRLGAIGQTDAQKIIAKLSVTAEEIANKILDTTVDDLGGSCLRSDIASMKHETQYTRLFRS
jgi:urease accessory protein